MEGKPRIMCAMRKKYLVWTPEEIVRQCLVHFLLEEGGFSKNRIAIEKKIEINGVPQRFDLAVMDEHGKPFLLVECKAPQIAITQNTFDQAARYNILLGAPYLMVTNGIFSYLCEVVHESREYRFLQAIQDVQKVKNV